MELQVCSVIDGLIINPKGQSIATCWGNQRKRKALAKELVRRWNSQPDLLEACEVAILALTHQPINQKDIEFIQQAIAKAEKGD